VEGGKWRQHLGSKSKATRTRPKFAVDVLVKQNTRNRINKIKQKANQLSFTSSMSGMEMGEWEVGKLRRVTRFWL